MEGLPLSGVHIDLAAVVIVARSSRESTNCGPLGSAAERTT